MKANDLRPGMVIIWNDELYRVHEATHRTPGNKRAFMQAKLFRIRDGVQTEHKFSSTEGVEKAFLSAHQMQFLYKDGEGYHFMNTESYDQTTLPESLLGHKAHYLQENATIDVTYHEQIPVGIALPQTMEFDIIEAEPGIKNATATSSYKQAKIETGFTIKVPQFIGVGERIKVNTETDEYLERAKK